MSRSVKEYLSWIYIIKPLWALIEAGRQIVLYPGKAYKSVIAESLVLSQVSCRHIAEMKMSCVTRFSMKILKVSNFA